MALADKDVKKSHLKDGIIDFIAGTLGGIALVYVGQPLDTIKVKMQTFPDLYKNMFHCLAKTYRNDGIYKGLYAGTVPALAANVAENSVLFLGYGFCQKLMMRVTHTKDISELSTLSNATAGFLASSLSSVALCPTELVKCKLQAMREVQKEQLHAKYVKHIGPAALTAEIIRNEGVLGLFHGLTPTLLREMPGYFFFFGGYEATRSMFTNDGQTKDDIGLFKTMVAGGVGGLIFWIITYPVDVIKSRIQVNNEGKLIPLFAQIVKKEGVLVLYNGLLPTLIRTIPATATLFVTYEYCKKFLHYSTSDL